MRSYLSIASMCKSRAHGAADNVWHASINFLSILIALGGPYGFAFKLRLEKRAELRCRLDGADESYCGHAADEQHDPLERQRPADCPV